MTTHGPDAARVRVAAGPDPGPALGPTLGPAALRRVVAVLGLSQITSWGCLYYGFAALQSAITADTGWTAAAVTGAFSVGQLVCAAVGIWVGRRLDTHGPRRLMTGAGVLALPGMVAVATAPSLPVFYLGWVVVGAAMAGTLYPPAFAALTRWGGARRVRALTTVTLAGGLASTLFAPVAVAIDAHHGWRTAFLTLAALAASVTVPLHWWGLRHPWPASPAAVGAGDAFPYADRGPAPVAAAVRSPTFAALATANGLVATAAVAVVINLVPMLREQGASTGTAAVVLGLGGVGQVVGRLGYTRFAVRTSVSGRSVIVPAGIAVLTAGLALAPPVTAVVVVIGLALGLARGAYTLVQATAVTDRWGPGAYGRLNGVLTAPALMAGACAPFVGALLADLTGSYAVAFLVLAGLAAAGAALMLCAGTSSPARPVTRAR